MHAIDIDRNAVANTLANAFRNGVADRVTGDTADLFDWEPDRSFDVVVASLYQLPVDPFDEPTGHRPLDYWGRTLLDHFLRLLPRLLAPGGTAYVHADLDRRAGSRRSGCSPPPASRPASSTSASSRSARCSSADKPQIERVEQLSDAYHIAVGDEDVMVAYLLEITHSAP